MPTIHRLGKITWMYHDSVLYILWGSRVYSVTKLSALYIFWDLRVRRRWYWRDRWRGFKERMYFRWEARRKCLGTVPVWNRHRQYTLPCGSWDIGEGRVYCTPCDARMHLQFPQGWRYYPGDTCPHGMYVGGCGIDWICGRCEMGD